MAVSVPPSTPPATLLSLPSDLLRVIADHLRDADDGGAGWDAWRALSVTCRALRSECLDGASSLRLPAGTVVAPSALRTALWGELVQPYFRAASVLDVDAAAVGAPPPVGSLCREKDVRLSLTPGRCAALATATASLASWVGRLARGTPVRTLHLGVAIAAWADRSGLETLVYASLMPALTALPLTALTVTGAALGAFLGRPLPAARLTSLTVTGCDVGDPAAAPALRHLLRAHGGSLRVLSVGLGEWLRDTWRLPVWAAADAAGAGAPTPPALPALHTFRTGYRLVDADVRWLVAACPALTELELSACPFRGAFRAARAADASGGVGGSRGGWPALKTVAVRLSPVKAAAPELWADLPDLLARRKLSTVTLPPVSWWRAPADEVAVVDALRAGAALPATLVLAGLAVAEGASSGTYGDAAVGRLVEPPAMAAGRDGGHPSPARALMTGTTATLTDLTLHLSEAASWTAFDHLAALPRLTALHVDLSSAVALTATLGRGWPPFPALSTLTLAWQWGTPGNGVAAFLRGLGGPAGARGGAAEHPAASGCAGGAAHGGTRGAPPTLRRLTLADGAVPVPGVARLRRGDLAAVTACRGLARLDVTVAAGWWVDDAYGGGGGAAAERYPHRPTDGGAYVTLGELRGWLAADLPRASVRFDRLRSGA